MPPIVPARAAEAGASSQQLPGISGPGTRDATEKRQPELPLRERVSSLKRAAKSNVRPFAKPQRITPADEEVSDELLHIFHNPVQGWWSNRWVVELENDGAHAKEDPRDQ